MKLFRFWRLACLALMCGPPAAHVSAQIIRGPYLQLGTPNSIVIRWRTLLPTDSQVCFGTNFALLDRTNTLADLTTEHIVQLTGLNPSTCYFYTIGDSLSIPATATLNQCFVTSPPAGTRKPTRIWVIGDAGVAGTGDPTNTANQMAVRDAFYQLIGTNQVDFWLQLGDNAYSDGTDDQYQAGVFDIYNDLLRRSVTWPTLGNHDTAQLTDYTTNYPYFSIFTLPTAGEAGGVPSGTPHYYSFDYANIHLICLDSMTADRSPTGAMAMWLEADLQANTNQWIIAFWHHPPYSKGAHDSDLEINLADMRENFVPILEAYGVDLVLSGHSHSYERSFLLNGHYGMSTTLNAAMVLDPGTGREEDTGAYTKPRGGNFANLGAVYTVAGSSGSLEGGALNHPAMCISTNVLGSMLLEVNSNRLDAIFLRETGATNDHFTILKANYAPVASNLVFNVPGDTPSDLTLTGSDTNGDSLTFSIANLPVSGLLSRFNPTNGTVTYTPARGSYTPDSFGFMANDGTTNSPLGVVTILISPPADTNVNGIADAWEAQYQINDPSADPDGDGFTNMQEYWAGTNPLDKNSALRILSITPEPGGGFTLLWSSVGAVRYRVLYSDGNSAGGFNGLFNSVVRDVTAEMDPSPPGVPGQMRFTDDYSLAGTPVYGVRYYRIQVVR